MNETEVASKQREYIPDVQHKINECRDTVNRISHLVSKLTHSMDHPSDEEASPEKPRQEPTQLEELVESTEILSQRLRNIEVRLGGNLTRLLGDV